MSVCAKGGIIAATVLGLSGPLFGATVSGNIPTTVNRVQGQLFYSTTVSRISNGDAQACMVSTGSEWHKTAEARLADDVSEKIENGASFAQAFEEAAPVDPMGLSSNTPYMAFVIDQAGETFLRFATGFQIDARTVAVSYGMQSDAPAGFVVEKRGDTGTFRDPSTVDAMLEAFMSGDVFEITARSEKTGLESVEHYLRYQFVGQGNVGELSDCLADLVAPEMALGVSNQPHFSLSPVENGDLAMRMTARAMACNRELNSDETEVMAVSGDISGFSSPLAYALISRNEDGVIEDIWSGDLWRISKLGDRYVLAISNSITTQSPLDAQDTKACTQFGAAQPVSLSEDLDGVLEIAPASGGLFAGIPDLPVLGGGFASPAVGFAPSPTLLRVESGGSAGQSAAGGGSTPFFQTVVTSSPGTSVSEIVSGTPDEELPKGEDDPDDVNEVPVPAAGLLMVGALIGLGATFGRRRRKCEGPGPKKLAQ